MAKQYAIEHKFDESLDYRLCAVIVSGGRILSVGFNKRTKNSFVRHFQKGVREFCLATHAEQSCVLKIRKKIDLTGSKIYVVRLGGHNGESYAMARACTMCQRMLRNYGINKVYYSINEHQYGILKLLSNGQDADEVHSIG